MVTEGTNSPCETMLLHNQSQILSQSYDSSQNLNLRELSEKICVEPSGSDQEKINRCSWDLVPI